MSSSTYNLVTGDIETNANANANTNVNVNGTATTNGHTNGHANEREAGAMNGHGHTNTNANAAGRPQAQSINIHPTLKYTNSIPLPPYITSIIQTETKMSSLMGILPQGNMVWVSVDDALYLWEYGGSLSLDNYSYSNSNFSYSYNGSYGDGSGAGGGLGGHSRDDFVCFRVPSGQCIVSVGLVRPKRGKSIL